MFADMITFLKDLPQQALGSTDIIPDSIEKSVIPITKVLDYFQNLSTTVKLIIAVVTLILALIGCFRGYKLSRFFMSLTGLVFGAVVAVMIATGVFELATKYVILCAIGGAVLMALAAYWIYKIGLFILCFVFAFFAAATWLPLTGDIQFFVATVIGFIVGALALMLMKPVIIITSGVACGFYAAGVIASICEYMGYALPVETVWIAGVIAIAGILVQFITTKDEKKAKRRKRKHDRKKTKKHMEKEA